MLVPRSILSNMCGLAKSLGPHARIIVVAQPLCFCRYIAYVAFAVMIIKELAKCGVVLFLLVRRGGKVPVNLGWSDCVVLV